MDKSRRSASISSPYSLNAIHFCNKAISLVTSLVTFGLPSLSPPIHVPNLMVHTSTGSDLPRLASVYTTCCKSSDKYKICMYTHRHTHTETHTQTHTQTHTHTHTTHTQTHRHTHTQTHTHTNTHTSESSFLMYSGTASHSTLSTTYMPPRASSWGVGF